MKPSFFEQCAATSEHLALISQLQTKLNWIRELHIGALSFRPIKAEEHRKVIEELKPYLPTDKPSG